jgi:anti-sigma factor RsiW
MTHVEEGVLQAYLDAEVTAGARADIDRHLHSCSTCAAELERMRNASHLFHNVLQDSDVVAPVLAAQARFATSRRSALRPMAVPQPRRAWARAAMFVVGLGAVASAAVPGSPVRAWISDALTRAGLLNEPQSAAAPVLPEEAPAVQRDATAESTALSIEAVDGRIRVILRNVSPETVVTVRPVDSDRAVVEATGAAAKARFRTGAGLLEVDGVTGGTVIVEIPRSATDAVVEQDGKTIYRTGR